jgi:hypothetical protein
MTPLPTMDGGVVLREIRSLSNANQWSAVVKVLTGDRRPATGDRRPATGSRRDRRASDGLPCGRRMVHFSDGVYCGIAPDVVQDQWPACVGGRTL